MIYNMFYKLNKGLDKNSPKFKEQLKMGSKILQLLYEANKKVFLKNIKINKNNSIILKNENGNIDLYGEKYLKK